VHCHGIQRVSGSGRLTCRVRGRRGEPHQTLIALLSKLLALLRDAPERAVGRRLGVRVPPLAHIVEWLGLLLDSHFSALILLPDAHPLLRSVRIALMDHLSICRSSSSLKGFLTAIAQRNALVSRPDTGDYYIEVFQL